MFNITQRFQDITGYMSTVACFIAALVSIVSLIQLNLAGYNEIPGDLTIKNTQNVLRFSRTYGGHSGSGKENVRMKFDLKTDLTPLFNWNTKQVFVYLVGLYDGPSDHPEAESKVVFWDEIIKDEHHAKLNLRNRKTKYSVYDYYSSMQDRNVTVKLEFNVQPWIGPEVWGVVDAADEVTFKAPTSKGN